MHHQKIDVSRPGQGFENGIDVFRIYNRPRRIDRIRRLAACQVAPF